jgi:ATP-dependent Clp protease protease subunit
MQSTALREIATRFDIVYRLSHDAPFGTVRRRCLEYADHADAWAHGLSLDTLLNRALFARVTRDRMKQQGETMPHFQKTLIASLALTVLIACTSLARSNDVAKKPSEPQGAGAPAVAPAAAPTAAPAPDATEVEIKRLRQQAELREQELNAQLASLRAEKAKLEAELALNAAKQSSQAEPEKTKIDAMQRAAALRDAALRSELAGNAAELEKMKQAQALAQAKIESELAANKGEMDRIRSAQDLLDMKHRAKLAESRREQETLAADNMLAAERRKVEQSKLADEQTRAEIQARTASALLQERDGKDKLRDLVTAPMTYPKDPFQNGVLTVSDRKIALDGPIVTGTSDYVCERIDYFNNLDRTAPIFIVINNSPGGSVMQGYRILKAIETSDAPVHVVVRSFAASMAATIATLAPHSYAYPNAIILHHQMSGGASGNMTDIEQEVKTMKEWERRLAEPIARKMGISLDEFKSRMYSAKKNGDWDEFADKAVQLKWVDHLVNEIREEGIRKKPEEGRVQQMWSFMMDRDEQGKPFMRLPPLEPYDCYFMVNPRGFYRVDGR